MHFSFLTSYHDTHNNQNGWKLLSLILIIKQSHLRPGKIWLYLQPASIIFALQISNSEAPNPKNLLTLAWRRPSLLQLELRFGNDGPRGILAFTNPDLHEQVGIHLVLFNNKMKPYVVLILKGGGRIAQWLAMCSGGKVWILNYYLYVFTFHEPATHAYIPWCHPPRIAIQFALASLLWGQSKRHWSNVLEPALACQSYEAVPDCWEIVRRHKVRSSYPASVTLVCTGNLSPFIKFLTSVVTMPPELVALSCFKCRLTCRHHFIVSLQTQCRASCSYLAQVKLVWHR